MVGRIQPYYKERDTDEMINRITSFMEDHPTLFVHLYLHEECLFGLGGELAELNLLTLQYYIFSCL